MASKPLSKPPNFGYLGDNKLKYEWNKIGNYGASFSIIVYLLLVCSK